MDNPTDSSPLRWEDAIPFKAWLSAPALRRRSTVVFVLMVVAPAAIFWYVSNLATGNHSASYDFNWLGWAFAAYVGIAWMIVLWLLVRPKLVPWHAALVVALAVATQVPLAIFLETKLHSNSGSLVPSIVTVGLPEEISKLLPLLGAIALTYIVARHRMKSWLELSPRSYLFLGALSGLAFGCAEQAHYLVHTYVPQLLGTQNPLGGVYTYTEQVTWRLISDPISHACWAGISGYFLGIAIQRLRRIPAGSRRYPREIGIALTGLAIAAVLHGINDDVVSAGDEFLWIVTVALSALLFIGYASAGEVVEEALVGISHSHWNYRVGDRVQLPSDPQPTFHSGAQKIHWTKRMNVSLRKAATITALNDDGTARLDVDAGADAWPLRWLRPLVTVGDRVRIPAQPQPPFDAGGYIVSWQPDMDSLEGRSATVTSVVSPGTVQLDVGRPAQEWALDWLDRDAAGAGAVAESSPTASAPSAG
jgi:RsiW-degrading membrane proteinase PrsW (M82 family)